MTAERAPLRIFLCLGALCARLRTLICLGALRARLRIFLCLGVLCALLLVSPSCLFRRGGAPDVTREVKIGVPGELDSLCPLLPAGRPSGEITGLLYRSLFTWNEKWKPVPDMARAAPAPGQKGDFFTVETTIDPKARWSDGKAFETRDFIFTYQLALNPRLRNPRLGWVPHVATIAAPAPDRIRLVWKSPCPGVDTFFAPLPRHALQATAFADPASLASARFDREAVTNGPFRLKELRQFTAVLERNPGWTGRAPSLDRITCFVYSTEEEMVRKLRSGAVDLAVRVPFASWRELKDDKTLDVRLVPSGVLKTLCFNLDAQPLQSPLARKALFLALDRRAIAKALFSSEVSAAGSYLPPHSELAIDCLPSPDLAQARALAEKAGLKGRRLIVMYSWADVQSKSIAALVQRAWQAIGVQVEYASLSPKKFQECRDTRAFPHVLIADIPMYPWTSLRQLFATVGIPDRTNGFRGLNWAGWRNAASDRLCALQRSPFDQELQKGLWKEHQELFSRELPFIPLCFVPEAAAARRGLQGWRYRGFGEYTWNAECWSWSR